MKTALLTAAAISSLLMATACSDRTETPDAPAAASASAPGTAELPPAQREKLLQDAVLALQATESAIAALDAGDAAGATAALERATGKLEIVLAQNPELALAPVDVAVITRDVLASVEAVTALRKSAEEALEDGRIQEARHLIEALASETVVQTSNLPLATYPAAIKSAAALVAQNKLEEAKTVLETALGTIVIEDVIHPLPLLRASTAIEEARKLAAGQTRGAAEDARIKAFLTTAREQLKLGQALGYATKEEMETLLRTVDEIEEGVKNRGTSAGVFDRIRDLFSKANASSQPKQNG